MGSQGLMSFPLTFPSRQCHCAMQAHTDIDPSTRIDSHTSLASPSVRIQLLSDLHLEMPRPSYWGNNEDGQVFEYDFPARADVLALLGDIGATCEDRLFSWLTMQLQRFKLVLFLSGNHEAYHSSLVSESISICTGMNRVFGLGCLLSLSLDPRRNQTANSVSLPHCATI